jgi:hypothetical protein
MGATRVRVASAGALIVTLVVASVSGLQPVAAHISTPGHVWRQHIRPLADARYLQNSKVFRGAEFSLGALADGTATRLCPPGRQAVGGGVDFETEDADVQVISSAPMVSGANLFVADEGGNPAAQGWRVTMHNEGLLAVSGVVGVICAK